MTPATVIGGAHADGIILAVSSNGNIKAAGPRHAVNRWMSQIREHKTRIIVALKADRTLIPKASTPTSWCPLMAAKEAFDERAAILEFDAGLTREEAERQARMMIAAKN